MAKNWEEQETAVNAKHHTQSHNKDGMKAESANTTATDAHLRFTVLAEVLVAARYHSEANFSGISPAGFRSQIRETERLIRLMKSGADFTTMNDAII